MHNAKVWIIHHKKMAYFVPTVLKYFGFKELKPSQLTIPHRQPNLTN